MRTQHSQRPPEEPGLWTRRQARGAQDGPRRAESRPALPYCTVARQGEGKEDLGPGARMLGLDPSSTTDQLCDLGKSLKFLRGGVFSFCKTGSVIPPLPGTVCEDTVSYYLDLSASHIADTVTVVVALCTSQRLISPPGPVRWVLTYRPLCK